MDFLYIISGVLPIIFIFGAISLIQSDTKKKAKDEMREEMKQEIEQLRETIRKGGNND
jgi:hypothetical protein